MRKVLLIILILVAMLLLATSCGGNSNTSGDAMSTWAVRPGDSRPEPESDFEFYFGSESAPPVSHAPVESHESIWPPFIPYFEITAENLQGPWLPWVGGSHGGNAGLFYFYEDGTGSFTYWESRAVTYFKWQLNGQILTLTVGENEWSGEINHLHSPYVEPTHPTVILHFGWHNDIAVILGEVDFGGGLFRWHIY